MPRDPHDFLDPFEGVPLALPGEIFARKQYYPVAPGDLEPGCVAGALWELIYAMAAQRVYLIHTNHLSDSQLYDYLTSEWLVKPTPDLPPEAGWNCFVDMSENGASDTWLRYYASEEERSEYAGGQESLPPMQDPVFDRDDWLPMPVPEMMENDEEEFDEDMAMPDDEDDPLGLRAVERAIHLDSAISNTGDCDDNPDDGAAAESAEDELAGGRWVKPIELLPALGVNLLPPAELTDGSVCPRLWEIIQALARMRLFLQHTDHLDDRALYEGLWSKVLRQQAYLPNPGEKAAWIHDFVGSDNLADRTLWLACYASDDERRELELGEGITLPRKRVLASNRDWRLPYGSLEF